MSIVFDLLPVAWGLAIPRPISDSLLDMELACNDATLLVDVAQLEHRRSLNGAGLAEASGSTARYRGHLASQVLECTLTYIDQLAAAYTAAACTLATYASAVAVALRLGQELPVPDPEPVLPSRVLAEPERHVPLVQLGAAVREDDAVIAHDAELVGHHGDVLEKIATAVRFQPPHAYDEPSRLASRPLPVFELQLGLARALHCYGANCAWALALATRH